MDSSHHSWMSCYLLFQGLKVVGYASMISRRGGGSGGGWGGGIGRGGGWMDKTV